MALPKKQTSLIELIMKGIVIIGFVISIGGWINSVSNHFTKLDDNYANINNKLDVIVTGQNKINDRITEMDNKVNKNHDETICEFYDLELMISPKEAVDPFLKDSKQ